MGEASEALAEFGAPVLLDQHGEEAVYISPGGISRPVRVIHASPYATSTPLDAAFGNQREEVIALLADLPDAERGGTLTWPLYDGAPRTIVSVQPHPSMGTVRLALSEP